MSVVYEPKLIIPLSIILLYDSHVAGSMLEEVYTERVRGNDTLKRRLPIKNDPIIP